MKHKGLFNLVVITMVIVLSLSGIRIVNANKYLNLYVDAFRGYNVRSYARYTGVEEQAVEAAFNNYVTDYLITHVTSKTLTFSPEVEKELGESVSDFRENTITIDIIEVDETTNEARIYVSKTKLFSEILHILNRNITNSTLEEEYSDRFGKSLIEALDNTSTTGRYEMTIEIDYDRETKTYSISDKYLKEILAVVTGL